MTPSEQRITNGVYAFFWFAIAVLFLVILFVTAYAQTKNPVLTYDEKADRFLVSFPEGGYFYACTRFTSLKETIIMDGREVRYEPRDCGILAAGEKQTSYVQPWGFVEKNGGEWEVTAILQKEDATEYPSNTVTVIH